MFLSISAFRPTEFTVYNSDNPDEAYTLSFHTPLSLDQVVNTFKVPGVELGVILYEFEKSKGDDDALISGNVLVRSTPTGCVVLIDSSTRPHFTMVSGFSVVW